MIQRSENRRNQWVEAAAINDQFKESKYEITII